MATKKTSKYIINTPGDYPDELKGKTGTAKDPVPGVKTTHLITATDKIVDKYFYTDTTWLWSGRPKNLWGRPTRMIMTR